MGWIVLLIPYLWSSALVQRVQNTGREGCVGLRREAGVAARGAESSAGVGPDIDAVDYR